MRAEFRDSLEFFFPDSKVGKKPVTAVQVDVARGGTAAVHLLLKDLAPGAEVSFTVKGKRGPAAEAQWFRLHDVPVEVNSGPVGFVEAPGEVNPDVIRRAPFRVYDAMEPVEGTVTAHSAALALRLHLPIAPSARPGEREYTVEVGAGAETFTGALTVTVYGAAITPVGRESFPYTNWFSYKIIAARHGLVPWSEKHWQMLRRYADLMARTRQNTFWVPQADIFRVEKGVPVLETARLRRIVDTFTAAGLYFIEGGHFGTRATDDWKSPTFKINLTGNPATSAQGNADIAVISRQLMAEIARGGWEKRWIQHIADEPIAENAADYRIFTGIVRKYMPGLPILDATMYEGLVGSVDIWCPQAQEYQAHVKHFDAQRALGDRVWFYTCCFPGGPWLNRLLDMELLRPALFGWGAALYGLDGFLHWGFNHYRTEQDPLEMSVVPHGDGSRLPAGDTHVVYPGTNGPWSSLRLEAQREGFEDYELLRRLHTRDPQRAMAVIRKAIRGFDKYTKSAKVFRGARREMLEALKG